MRLRACQFQDAMHCLTRILRWHCLLLQMSLPQLKSIYKANAHTYQPCAPSPVGALPLLSSSCACTALWE